MNSSCLTKTTAAAILFLASAMPANATILVQMYGSDLVGQGLYGFTLHAHSTDPNQTIVGVADPSIVAYPGGLGLHQVWTPPINLATPTRGSQIAAGPLWSDTWQPFDSYWLFGASAGDTIAVGTPFNETNSGTGGASLGSAGFGVPKTGFGSMSGVGGATAFTASSGKQGQDVDLAHLVMQLGPGLLFNGTILTGDGEYTTFTNLPMQICSCGITVPSHIIDNVNANSPGFVDYTWTYGADFPQPPNVATWTDFGFQGYSGSAGNVQVTPATFDYATGKFHWNSVGAPPGQYTWYAAASGQGYNSQGFLSVRVTAVPEPSIVFLLGIPALTLLFARCRT